MPAFAACLRGDRFVLNRPLGLVSTENVRLLTRVIFQYSLASRCGWSGRQAPGRSHRWMGAQVAVGHGSRRPARVRRQDGAGKVLIGLPVVQPRRPHLQPAGDAPDGSFANLTCAHDQGVVAWRPLPGADQLRQNRY